MLNCNASSGLDVTPAELMSGYLVSRKGEILDAVITAAALVARADGWVDPLERRRLIDYLERNRLLSITRTEILSAFENRVREIRQPGGAVVALHRVARCGGRSLQSLIVNAAREVAAADDRLDPRESYIVTLIRRVLRGHVLPAAPETAR